MKNKETKHFIEINSDGRYSFIMELVQQGIHFEFFYNRIIVYINQEHELTKSKFKRICKHHGAEIF
jgi:hypothetical protein